jgi:mannose-1-phosphate guanylyltransferase
LTQSLPKCLAPIGGEPLLGIWLELFEREGVTDVLLNVSHHFDAVDAFLERRRRASVRVRLTREEAPVGTATTVQRGRAFVQGDESFWVFYADNLTDVRLAPMLERHRGHQEPLTLGLFHAPRPESAGIVELDEAGRVTAFVEKPASPRGRLANAGVYLARQALFDWIPESTQPTDFGVHVLPALAGRMFGYVIPEFHADIGTLERLGAASAAWAAERSRQGTTPDLAPESTGMGQ